MEPVTVSIADACKATGLGRNSIYNLINGGTLSTVKIGRRQLVHVESIKKLVGAA
ncbi:helix-turn-helix domain-containing protein [Sphingomonas faeni]|uniref:helix-turn-helix domain-containing protein n=1 Tax=Sphingomonas faeni TaxID=185950 RepID=UPI0020BF4589|nr:helix-turn-helix domain-containing protein [Sphingomonas faeni]MCK8457040.1 helix-turn-helix domain-containing protein [Sphingomonas faeni]